MPPEATPPAPSPAPSAPAASPATPPAATPQAPPPAAKASTNAAASAVPPPVNQAAPGASGESLEGSSAPADGNAKPRVEPDPFPDAAKVAARAAALARQERQIREREKQAAQKAQELEAWNKSRGRVKEDPLGALEELGFDFQSLVDAQLARAKSLKEAPPKSQEELVSEAVEKKAKALQEAHEKRAEEARFQQAETNFKKTISNHIAGDESRAELFAAEGATESDVLELIKLDWDEQIATLKRDGHITRSDGKRVKDAQLMSVEAATARIEQHLEGQAKARLEKLQGLRRFKAQEAPKDAPTAASEAPNATPAKPADDAPTGHGRVIPKPTVTVRNVLGHQAPVKTVSIKR